MRLRRLAIPLVLAAVALTGCGGDDDTTADDVAGDGGAADSDANGDDADADTADADAGATAPAGGGGNGTATLTLDNGETFEFSILCSLESQIAAGSEILFSVVSYDDPGLDITQFGDEGTVTGMASISVYDGSYDTLWEAATVYEAFGGEIELALDGSTVRGTGSFYPAADAAAQPVPGEVVANC